MSYKDRLTGVGKYAAQDSGGDALGQETLVEKANNLVSIVTVLAEHGIEVPLGAVGWKFHCPWGQEHSDGGMDKAARYYPESNTAYCFASSHGVLTPVRLRAREWKMSEQKAARKILEDAGIAVGKVSYRKKWSDLHEAQEVVANELNRQAVMEALSVSLRSLPNFTSRQYDADVREVMERALSILEHVSTADEARLWVRSVTDRVKDLTTS